jgi:hypothetical protein
VLNIRVGHCLGPEGKGDEGGLGPQAEGKISSQLSTRKEATWSRKKKEGRVMRDEEEPAYTE